MKRSIHAVAWVLLVVAAVVLWPQRWGGTMTYVVTSGTSMQPFFNAGDLAVLRSADDYDVGDVVAYRSRELDQVVLHRIRTDDGRTYTFKGDNNDFVDPDELQTEDILGELALRVPRVGPVVAWMLRPLNILLAVGAVYLLTADRRPREVPAPEVPAAATRVMVTAFRVPEGVCIADAVSEQDLVRLADAARCPLLQNQVTGESFVHDGAVVYRHVAVVQQAPEVGSGRDWRYGVDADVIALMPRPRRAAAQINHGLDVVKLLKLG